jgi:general secretion pathway protein D
MTTRSPARRLLPFAAALALLAATGCTSYRMARRAEQAEAREQWDEAVVHYLDLADRDPGNARWRSALLRAKLRSSQEHFSAGRRFAEAGVPERAIVEYERAVTLDPTNQYAQVELDKAREELAAKQAGAKPAPTLEELKEKTRGESAQPPLLNPRSAGKISLNFPQPQSLFAIYQALGKAFGINILFDPQLRDQQMAIELRDVDAQTGLETLMRAAGQFYKVIDEHTILIAQDTQQNRRTYEDLVIQTFYLSNAEVKDAVQLLRSLISSRNIATNEQLNAVTIRDTADKVKIAQRILETIDKARSEVVVDIELIQVNATKMRDLGVSLSSNQVTQTLDLGKDVPVRFPDLRNLSQQSWSLTIPSIIYDFLKSNSDAQLLAKPQIRVTEGEKAEVKIGDQVPIPVTSFNTSNTVGSSVVPITSFQYKDVGINISVEPRVHHNKEVTLKLSVQVSQITGYQDAGNGQQQPIIGNRSIQSTIRLKDGETNFLAGLIRTDQSNGETGIPGLSDIPVIGKLFGKTTTDTRRTDIMLTLTPHIVRTADITANDLRPIWVGTEANMSFRGGSPRAESPEEGPFDQNGDNSQQLEEKLRRAREQQQENQQAQPPSGVDLVPGAGVPSSPFENASPPAQQPSPVPPPAVDETPPPGSAAASPASFPSLPYGTPLDVVPASPSQSNAVHLALDPQVVSVEPGQTFKVAISVNALVPVSHLPSTLAFDPKLLAVDRVEAGGFLGGPSQAQVLADTSSAGTIVLGASRLGKQAGVAGSGIVATITFRALAAGSGAIHFADRRVLGPDLVEIAGVETKDAAVEVRPAAPVAPVPPPATATGGSSPR